MALHPRGARCPRVGAHHGGRTRVEAEWTRPPGRRRSRRTAVPSPIPSSCPSSTASTWSGSTIDRIVEVFEGAGLRYQLVLVNDGSRDGSWEVIAEAARANPHLVALNLLQNYGQHHANVAGFREATGDFVITLDDDLQNPPEEALTPHRRGDVRLGRRVRPVRPQAGGRLPTRGHPPDQHDQPAGLRAAARAHRVQLPDPPPRRGRPDLRLPDRAPLHHRSGADVLQHPHRRPGAPRPPAQRQERLLPGPDPAARLRDPLQLLLVPAAGGRGVASWWPG